MVGDRESGSRIPLAFLGTVDYWGEWGECQVVTGTQMRWRGSMAGRSGISSRHCGQTMVEGKWGDSEEAGSDGTIPAVLLQADPGLGPGEGFSIVYNTHGPHREKRDENVRDSLATFPCGWFRNEEAARPWHPGAWRRSGKNGKVRGSLQRPRPRGPRTLPRRPGCVSVHTPVHRAW